MKPLSIIKIGGNLLDNEVALNQAINSFSKIEGAKILVHGGGKKTSELCLKLGIAPNMHKGRRITDQATLEVATMVYAGLFNKKLVSKLQHLKCNAIGFSGADGNVILSKKRPIKEVDFGMVGDVESINDQLIINLLETGFVPVFCAITHDGKGQLLNTNADTIASVLAATLSSNYEVALKFCFEKEGILSNPKDENSVFPKLSMVEYLENRAKGIIYEGMIPKIDNAFDAKHSQVKKVMICGIEGINQTKGTEICL